jgi:hypothetical protein
VAIDDLFGDADGAGDTDDAAAISVRTWRWPGRLRG